MFSNARDSSSQIAGEYHEVKPKNNTSLYRTKFGRYAIPKPSKLVLHAETILRSLYHASSG